jgi:hypothetical protein
LLHGWGVRPWNWEFSGGVQHEFIPRVSGSITYYHRVNGGFTVTKNTDVCASDFTTYNLAVPTDSRLPLSGQSLTFYDINPGLTCKGVSPLLTNNFITAASNYGNEYQHYNGFDITGNVRALKDVTVVGGITAGRQMMDNCQLMKQLPELFYGGGATPIPQQFCHFVSGRAPQYKALVSYNLPWQNIRVSGNYQSLPGPVRQASVIYSQAQVAAALGRTATVTGNKTANTIPYNCCLNSTTLSGSDYGDRLNQFDLRFSRIFKFGERGTLDANFDIYNAFNSDAVLTESATYAGANGGAWLLPTSVIVGRIIKFGGRWDF